MFVNYNNFNWYKVEELLIYMFCIGFNFDFLSQVYCELQPSKCFRYDTSKLVVVYEFCMDDFMLWFLLHIVCCPKCNNDVCVWYFYDN